MVACSDNVIEPDYGLLKAIQTVLEYYLPHDDWLEWMEKNPILVTMNSTMECLEDDV